jgi:Asp/Glu/hydantoin racemase
MASKSRNIVVGSMGIAGLMALAAVLDMALGIPFQGQIAFDIMFLLGAGLTLYMGFDCLKHAK